MQSADRPDQGQSGLDKSTVRSKDEEATTDCGEGHHSGGSARERLQSWIKSGIDAGRGSGAAACGISG
jgi:hypothetical protein